MEAKKNLRLDYSKKIGLFRSLGLLITMSLIVTAFQWKTYDKPTVDLQARSVNTFEEVMDIPLTQQPSPPPPQVLQAQFESVPDEQEIKDEIKVNLDIEVTEQTKVEQVILTMAEPEKEETDRIFTVVEETASPKGGMAAFYGYVRDNIQYPAAAKRMGIQGRVFVEFVIGKDGTIADVHTVKGIGAGCDEEAERIILSAPAWNPGKQRGKPVRQRYTLPIIFKMG